MNIFDNAYFGKAYRTRDGRKALYIKGDRLWIEGETDWSAYDSKGHWFFNGQESEHDIISEWHEEINKEELAKQYAENSLFGSKTKKQVAYNAYLAGYNSATNGNEEE